MENVISFFWKSMEYVHLILDSVTEGILIADNNSIVRYVNSAYLRITGLKHEEIIGKKVDDVRKGAYLPKTIQTGIPMQNIKRQVNNVEYIVDVCPIIIEGNIVGGITIARDKTQINNLIRKLEDYSNKVEQLENTFRTIYKAKYSFNDIKGISKEIEYCKQMAKKMALSTTNIMIRGESGTGKELFAHAIHNFSSRNSKPFVSINCSTIPQNLLLSELFGYEPGSFTGALKKGKIGLFEVANSGTFFLDEIGDMSYELQSKLLRVLETGEYFKIGATKPTKVDVRIIAATNRDLEYLIEENKFRKDLYYRLNAMPINIPPLRERKEDIPLLAEYLLSKINEHLGGNKKLTNKVYKCFQEYSWPGNVRQLKNAIDFAYNICSNVIDIECLPIEMKEDKKSKHDDKTYSCSFKTKLETTVGQREKEAIVKALHLYGLNLKGKKKVAKHLGISLSTLYNKINKYGINI